MTNEEIVNVLRFIKIGMSRTEREALDCAINVLEKEQTGKWKFVCQHWRKCSECGFSHKFAEDWNYCPNCGARMESEEK